MEKKVAVIVSGYFGPLHVGHLDMIEDAASRGDLVLAIVNNNEQQKIKKGKLIQDEADRLRIVSSLRDVDMAMISIDQDRTVCESLGKIASNYSDYELIFGNGGDRKGADVIPESEICEKYGIKIVFDMGGNLKADSSSRINMVLGVQDEPSAAPSASS